MLAALDLRRHNHRFYPSDQQPSPAIQQPHLSYFDTLPYTQSTPSPSTFNNNRPLGYFDAQSIIDSSSSLQGSNIQPSQYMNDYYGAENPAIRIQQSSPAPGMQLPQSFTDTSSIDNWNSQTMAVRPHLQAAAFQRNRTHNRAQSSSSMGSNASGSPYSQGHAAYYNVNDASIPTKIGQNYGNQDQSSSQFSNHLPTPTQTPTQDSFLSTSYPNSYSQTSDMNIAAAHAAMQNNLETHSNADDELPGMSHSGRQSVSSMGQDPSTPRTIPESYDDVFKVPANDQQMRFPKLDRTVSDAYQDALFSGVSITPAPATSAPKLNTASHLSPHRNTINEYLQRAQMARSQSPTSSGSRGVSPFRPSSPYISTPFGQAQRPYASAAQVRQAQQARASQMEMSQHVAKPQDDTPKTISPKDAVLEYNETEEDAKMPLFSEGEASAFNQQFGGGQQNFSTGVQNVGNQTNAWTNDAQSRQNVATTNNTAAFNFATPATNYSNGTPFGSQHFRTQVSSLKQEETPEFPAHLTSMESSASEAPMSSQQSNNFPIETTKPVASAADSGTYTCTYHGCNLRFESPQKLQKHKREGHRNPAVGTTPTPGVGSGMTSAELAARNSQQGPHKCERINPTTGKPCNTIFSRPYDLTRHEDTIHNARKMKVRCALCVEDKTFSRNDALTRHMRVVHPEVDFPGKHRRRGEH